MSDKQGQPDMRGISRAMFAAVLLLIAGTLNIVCGIMIFGDDERGTAT